MNIFSRAFPSSLIMALFLLFVASPAVLGGQSQTKSKSTTLMPWQREDPADLPTTEGWVWQNDVYEEFAVQVSHQPATAEEAKRCRCSRGNYSKLLGISPDEEQAMREIMFPVFVRLDKLQTEYQQASSLSSGMSPEQYGRLMEEQKAEKKMLVEEMIAKLRFAFSNEDFRKLDAYVYVESLQGQVALERKRERAKTASPASSGNTSDADENAGAPQPSSTSGVPRQ